jgi:hypothetical protein
MLITTCRRRKVRFSVTARIDAKVRAAPGGAGKQGAIAT